jgi:hypothetical protein
MLLIQPLMVTAPTRSCSSERMIKWLEKGVFDALEHKYLRTMMLGLCDSENPSVLLEAYEFHFRYISAEDNGGVDAIAMEFDNKTFSTKNAASSKAPSQEQGVHSFGASCARSHMHAPWTSISIASVRSPTDDSGFPPRRSARKLATKMIRMLCE